MIKTNSSGVSHFFIGTNFSTYTTRFFLHIKTNHYQNYFVATNKKTTKKERENKNRRQTNS